MVPNYPEKARRECSDVEHQLDLNQLAETLNSKVAPVFRSMDIPIRKENVLKYCFSGGQDLLFRTSPKAKTVIRNFPDFPNWGDSATTRELIKELDFDEKKNRFVAKGQFFREACVHSAGIKR